jgi:hypothetical protein
MKTAAIRSALLIVLFVVPPLFGPVHGALGPMLVDSAWAVAFACGAVYLTGDGPLFVPVAVFMATAAGPFSILCAIDLPGSGSWLASASAVISTMYHHAPMCGGEMLVPTLVATLAAWFLKRKRLTDDSSRVQHGVA